VHVEFTGVSGHAGTPHLAVDPIVAVADFVLQIQAMIARNFDPAVGGAVLTLGTIDGGTMPNAVAQSARVEGSLRVLTRAQHDLAFRRIREIAEGVATAVGARADVVLRDTAYLPVINDREITQRFIDYLQGRPDVRFEESPVTMTSEDYGYIVNHLPGMMFWLGVGGDDPLHSNKFSPDESTIEPTVTIVSDYLQQL